MQQFMDGDYVYNLTNLIVNALLDYGEFLKFNLGSKPMCFITYGVTSSQIFKLGVIK